jgi:integrase/recombinase XerD
MENFKNYLFDKYTALSAKRYLFAVKRFLEGNTTSNSSYASTAEIISYLFHLRNCGYNSDYVHTEFYGIRCYFKWLKLSKIRYDDPTDRIHLSDKSRNDIQFQNLLSHSELLLLLNKRSRYALLMNRDYFAISLYVFQGLTTGELVNLSVNDVDYQRQTINILSERNSSRILPLKCDQLSAFKKYMVFDRPYLIKENTNALFIGKLGQHETSDGFHYLIECQKNKFPNKKVNPKIIRQSVIANMLERGIDILEVKLFAGHKNITSTERYIQKDITELRSNLDRYYPI